jgi:hypothetical protein
LFGNKKNVVLRIMSLKTVVLRTALRRMERIGCPETSAKNYHYSPRNKPDERSSQTLRGGSLK